MKKTALLLCVLVLISLTGCAKQRVIITPDKTVTIESETFLKSIGWVEGDIKQGTFIIEDSKSEATQVAEIVATAIATAMATQ
jgi:hypothetical protein